MSNAPRISYVPFEEMSAEMQAEMERCVKEGTPRPESSAVRAHVPDCFWFFADSWAKVFRHGVVDHSLKELCRIYVSRSVVCEFCGNQRSLQGREAGVNEGQVDDLMHFEKSSAYSDREKAALAYAEAIVWRTDVDDAFWERMNAHFTEAELVELGCATGLTLGQQSWLRLLNIEHHQVMVGRSDASMAAGYETADAVQKTKSSPDYWARKPTDTE
ncbi:MAG: carboxymuconolactone decarboxylase family protein [Proteobacteria bacterium]|nr:carboxymuconolactone decarboxylase family protein [Pseudomonadota bacterium]